MPLFPLQAELIATLQKESRLPGPRANLELLQQFVAEASPDQVDSCLEFLNSSVKPDDPVEFVAMCGVAAAGRLLGLGAEAYEAVIRSAAAHASLRVRESAAIALQELGLVSRKKLLDLVSGWEKLSLLEKRCIVIAFCDARLLNDSEFAVSVLAFLDELLVEFDTERNVKSEDYRFLKKALGHSLGSAVTAVPAAGKSHFENWTRIPNNEVRWVLNENLKNSRLRRMDAGWVDQQIEYLNDAD